MISYTCEVSPKVDFTHLLDLMELSDATMTPVKVSEGFTSHLVEFTFNDMDDYKLFVRNIKEMELEAMEV